MHIILLFIIIGVDIIVMLILVVGKSLMYIMFLIVVRGIVRIINDIVVLTNIPEDMVFSGVDWDLILPFMVWKWNNVLLLSSCLWS